MLGNEGIRERRKNQKAGLPRKEELPIGRNQEIVLRKGRIPGYFLDVISAI